MRIIRTSEMTGITLERDLPVTIEQLEEFALPPRQRRLIQDIFPQLSAADREWLKTGITGEEWDAMFADDDDDEGEEDEGGDDNCPFDDHGANLEQDLNCTNPEMHARYEERGIGDQCHCCIVDPSCLEDF